MRFYPATFSLKILYCIVWMLWVSGYSLYGGLVQPSTLSDFINADQVLVVSHDNLVPGKISENVTVDGNFPLIAHNPRFLSNFSKDSRLPQDIEFTNKSFIYPHQCKYYLVFLDGEDGQWCASSVDAIIGSDQDIAACLSNLKMPKDSIQGLAQLASHETNLACLMQQIELLYKFPSGQHALDLKFPLNIQKDSDTAPYVDICQFAALLIERGASAFKEDQYVPDLNDLPRNFEGQVYNEKLQILNYYAISLESWILYYIHLHASADNYDALAKFARYKSGNIQAGVLVAISNSSVPDKLSDVIAIYQTAKSDEVIYGCIQNFCHAYSESIPSMPLYESKRFEMQSYWNKKLKLERN